MSGLFTQLRFVTQANNQWNIGADLGNDPMESAFARTLTAGIKGVAMVLDQEVQPLTCGLTKFGAAREQCFCLKFYPTKTKISCAEEFGACSNFSCPAVSTWNWSSSPMLALWVMLLGSNTCVCFKEHGTLQPMLFL